MTVAASPAVRIDTEFQSLIPPLSDDERRQLEENIKADGCRDPLVTWQGVLIDGHNRYAICTDLGQPFEVVEKEFDDRHEAIVWIIRNQRGRRNLRDSQWAMLAAKLANLSQGKKLANTENSVSQAEAAELFGVSTDLVGFARVRELKVGTFG